MPRHGQQYSNAGSNPILYYLKAQNRSKTDIKRLLNIGKRQSDFKLKHPQNFTLDELFKLAGYFRADVMEFVFKVYLNSKSIPKEQIKSLSDLVEKYTPKE